MEIVDYRTRLKGELERRKARNPSYSLRSFAQALGLKPSHLSQILSGKHGLSRESGMRIARVLHLNAKETEGFLASIEALHGRSRASRRAARSVLATSHMRHLSEDEFQMLADWKAYALLELSRIQETQVTLDRAAERLDISSSEAQELIERMVRLGLAEWGESPHTWRASYSRTTTQEEIPSLAIRSFHTRLISKSLDALERRPVEEREFRASVLSFPSEKMREAKQRIHQFVDAFNAEFGDAENPDTVSALSIQFFDLTPKPKPPKEH